MVSFKSLTGQNRTWVMSVGIEVPTLIIPSPLNFYLFIYLGFYVAFNSVQVISQWVVGRAEETSTYSWSRFCTVNCQPTASNYKLSHLRPGQEQNPGLRGGRRECYHSAIVVPDIESKITVINSYFGLSVYIYVIYNLVCISNCVLICYVLKWGTNFKSIFYYRPLNAKVYLCDV